MSHILYSATCVKVGKDQRPYLDAKLTVVCETLGVKKPELYLSSGSTVNAFTGGVDRHFIVLYSSLVQSMTDMELLAVLAHEVGHIHCQHMLYKVAADLLLFVVFKFGMSTPLGPLLNTLGLPVMIALASWRHKAELSCDRSALLVTQDDKVVMSALMKLAGGLKDLNLDAFIEQARAFDKNNGFGDLRNRCP